jgi:hypothetical protein
MTARDFAYWLQGYFEIHGKAESLTPQQVEMIKRHLALVFQHEIDPSFGDEQTQQTLNNIHGNNPMAHTQTPGVRC